MDQVTLELENLCGGAAAERFSDALDAVLANIADVNTEWKPARKIKMEIIIAPDESRKSGKIGFKVKPELAPHRSVESIIAIAREGGRLQAYEFQPQTQDKLDFEKLVPFRKGENSE